MPIQFKEVSFHYDDDIPREFWALKDINLSFKQGKLTAMIGKTGSGKSTLVQHLNALLLPSEGSIEVNDFTINANEKVKGVKKLREKVGLVFQFPEYQLFEETVLKDVAFGPQNFGVSEEEAIQRAREALNLVGISKEYYENSPLELSGGQKRRVAIAGILAMKPEILVLDEPTAGLDPRSTKGMMYLFKEYNKQGHTVILVTHNMDLVMEYCDEVVVMKDGKVFIQSDAETFFQNDRWIEESGLERPALLRIQNYLKKEGFQLDKIHLSSEELVKDIKDKLHE